MTAMPIHKYRAFPTHRPARPAMALARDRQGADVVQRRFARRQPGADRADGRPSASGACSTCWSRLGFKEIEVGFPAASQTDFDFVRELIDRKLIPDDVTIQVLTQLARRADRAQLRGDPRVPSARSCTSTIRPRPLQRRVVFGLDRPGIIDIAVTGARLISRSGARRCRRPSDSTEYSPESFTGTELDFAKEICERGDGCLAADTAAEDDLQPAGDGRDGDAQRLRRPDRVVLAATSRVATASSCRVHPHNDRGTGGRGGRSSPSWPVPTASRARCSATASAPATSTS